MLLHLEVERSLSFFGLLENVCISPLSSQTQQDSCPQSSTAYPTLEPPRLTHTRRQHNNDCRGHRNTPPRRSAWTDSGTLLLSELRIEAESGCVRVHSQKPSGRSVAPLENMPQGSNETMGQDGFNGGSPMTAGKKLPITGVQYPRSSSPDAAVAAQQRSAAVRA